MPLLVQAGAQRLVPTLWVDLQAPGRVAPVLAWHLARGDFRWPERPQHGRTTWLPRHTAAFAAVTTRLPRQQHPRNEDRAPESYPIPGPESWWLVPTALPARSARPDAVVPSPASESPRSAPRSPAVPSHTSMKP